MAVLALRKIEDEKEARGEYMFDGFEKYMEGVDLPDENGGRIGGYWDCSELVGSGEKNIKVLPRAPHYEVALLISLSQQENQRRLLKFVKT